MAIFWTNGGTKLEGGSGERLSGPSANSKLTFSQLLGHSTCDDNKSRKGNESWEKMSEGGKEGEVLHLTEGLSKT